MTVELPFTSPSFSFPLAGRPSSTQHTQTQEKDQMMMDASVAVDPSDFGKIYCSSSSACCLTLTQNLHKCMLVNCDWVCTVFGRDLCMFIIQTLSMQ